MLLAMHGRSEDEIGEAGSQNQREDRTFNPDKNDVLHGNLDICGEQRRDGGGEEQNGRDARHSHGELRCHITANNQQGRKEHFCDFNSAGLGSKKSIRKLEQ